MNKSKKVWDVIKDEQGNIQHILRDVKFKDCTILYERRTMVHVLMAALRSEGIPYFTTGNKGFYTSPAIIDIRNYLTFLSNRNNELALAGILLSPFFGVSDDELYAIRNAYITLNLLLLNIIIRLLYTILYVRNRDNNSGIYTQPFYRVHLNYSKDINNLYNIIYYAGS